MFHIWNWFWSVHIFGEGTGSGRKWNSRVHPEWREVTTKGREGGGIIDLIALFLLRMFISLIEL